MSRASSGRGGPKIRFRSQGRHALVVSQGGGFGANNPEKAEEESILGGALLIWRKGQWLYTEILIWVETSWKPPGEAWDREREED